MRTTALQPHQTFPGRARVFKHQAATDKQSGQIEKTIVTTSLVSDTEIIPTTITIISNKIAWFDWG